MSNVPLSVGDLFTPAPSGVGSNVGATPASGTWLAILYQIAANVGLPTTSWQPGGPERTILALTAVAFAQEDGVFSLINQGGLLDFAAAGSVTTTAINGQTSTQFVTPDPTITSQWPTSWNGVWQAGWLDLLVASVYGLQRIQQIAATNTLAIANTTASPIGPYLAGTYHVANPVTGASYSNVASLTVGSSILSGTAGVVTAMSGSGPLTVGTQSAHGLTVGEVVEVSGYVGITVTPTAPGGGFFAQVTSVPSPTTFAVGVTSTGSWSSGGTVYLCATATFTADVSGTSGTSAPNGISSTVTSNNGVSCTNLVSFVGSNWESNAALVARARLNIQSKSPNGPQGAYQYFALSASQLLGAQTPPVTLDGGPITKVLVTSNPQLGTIVTTIANASGTVEGVSNIAVTGCVSGSGGAFRLTVTSTTGIAANDFGTVSGVVGCPAANGTWQLTIVDGTHVELQGTTFAGTYVSGGTLEAGDLGQVDLIIQQNCVPDDVQNTTQSAAPFSVTIVAVATVPPSQATAFVAAAALALTAFFASPTQSPIGGTVLPGNTSPGFLYLSVVEGLLYEAGSVAGAPSYVTDIASLTLNGSAADLVYPTGTSVAVLNGSSTVNGVAV
jgi:hypothetical protein